MDELKHYPRIRQFVTQTVHDLFHALSRENARTQLPIIADALMDAGCPAEHTDGLRWAAECEKWPDMTVPEIKDPLPFFWVIPQINITTSQSHWLRNNFAASMGIWKEHQFKVCYSFTSIKLAFLAICEVFADIHGEVIKAAVAAKQ